jgi:hypothetical protein
MITIRMKHIRIRNIDVFSDECTAFCNGEFYANTKFLLHKYKMVKLKLWGMGAKCRRWRV